MGEKVCGIYDWCATCAKDPEKQPALCLACIKTMLANNNIEVPSPFLYLEVDDYRRSAHRVFAGYSE